MLEARDIVSTCFSILSMFLAEEAKQIAEGKNGSGDSEGEEDDEDEDDDEFARLSQRVELFNFLQNYLESDLEYFHDYEKVINVTKAQFDTLVKTIIDFKSERKLTIKGLELMHTLGRKSPENRTFLQQFDLSTFVQQIKAEHNNNGVIGSLTDDLLSFI